MRAREGLAGLSGPQRQAPDAPVLLLRPLVIALLGLFAVISVTSIGVHRHGVRRWQGPRLGQVL